MDGVGGGGRLPPVDTGLGLVVLSGDIGADTNRPPSDGVLGGAGGTFLAAEPGLDLASGGGGGAVLPLYSSGVGGGARENIVISI